MKDNRLLRVGEELKKELSLLLNLRFEDYARRLLTVTEVRVSKDLQYADVWVSMMGDAAAKKEMMGRLAADSYRFRMGLAGRIYLRHLPELRFHLDSTLDYADKIDSLLAKSLPPEPLQGANEE